MSAPKRKDFRVPLPPPKLPRLVPGAVKEKVEKTKSELKAEQREKELEGYRMKKLKLQDEKELEEENKAKRFQQTNYSSLDSNVQDEQQLFTYYCAYCGMFCIILDVDITTLPRRNGGMGDIGVEESKHTMRPQMHKDLEVGLIKREGGIEKQWRFKCQGCHLIIAYRNANFDQPAKYLYILSDALADDPAVAKRKILSFQQEQEEILAKKARGETSSSSSSSSTKEKKKKKKKRSRPE